MRNVGKYTAGQQVTLTRGEFRGTVLEVSPHSYRDGNGVWQIVLRVPGGSDWGRFAEHEVDYYTA